MAKCGSLISIWSASVPVRSISQYTLGTVSYPEHITIYSGQGPLSGAYLNILWARQSRGNEQAKLLVVTTEMVRSYPWSCAGPEATAAIVTALPAPAQAAAGEAN